MNSLWSRIEAFEIDTVDDELTFQKRLAQENGWSDGYTRRCINEYKKFIYLCAIAKETMTPSDQVDQVWHLHLTYTKSYWLKLCGEVLGFDLHHEPTKGGMHQAQLFVQHYDKTLECYRTVFQEEPPADIWPGVRERFRHSDKYIRINRGKTWSIRKPSSLSLALAALPVLLVACTQGQSDGGVWFYLKVALVVYVIYKVIKWLNSHSGGSGGSTGGCGGGCGGCGGD